jgi:hypothetical protein
MDNLAGTAASQAPNLAAANLQTATQTVTVTTLEGCLDTHTLETVTHPEIRAILKANKLPDGRLTPADWQPWVQWCLNNAEPRLFHALLRIVADSGVRPEEPIQVDTTVAAATLAAAAPGCPLLDVFHFRISGPPLADEVAMGHVAAAIRGNGLMQRFLISSGSNRAGVLCAALASQPELQLDWDLRGCDESAKAATCQAIEALLQATTKVTSFHLHTGGNTGISLSGLARQKQLAYLTVHGVGSQGMAGVCETLEISHTLQEVKIGCEQGMEALAQALASNPGSITDLDLNCFSADMGPVFGALAARRSLDGLRVTCDFLKPEWLIGVIQKNSRLANMHLRTRELELTGSEPMMHALDANRTLQVFHLEVAGMAWRESECHAISRRNHNHLLEIN